MSKSQQSLHNTSPARQHKSTMQNKIPQQHPSWHVYRPAPPPVLGLASNLPAAKPRPEGVSTQEYTTNKALNRKRFTHTCPHQPIHFMLHMPQYSTENINSTIPIISQVISISTISISHLNPLDKPSHISQTRICDAIRLWSETGLGPGYPASSEAI